jgi:hypothetical protein
MNSGCRARSAWSTGKPLTTASCFTAHGCTLWSRPLGRSGCVTTATTLTPGLAHNAAKLGQAISALPMKMTRRG